MGDCGRQILHLFDSNLLFFDNTLLDQLLDIGCRIPQVYRCERLIVLEVESLNFECDKAHDSNCVITLLQLVDSTANVVAIIETTIVRWFLVLTVE